MKELYQKNQNQLKQNSNYEKSRRGLMRKYSIDEKDKLNQQHSNCFSFSGMIDEMFLNPTITEQLQIFQSSNFDGSSNNQCANTSSSPTPITPSTPNSYGFQKSPYRTANVSIKHHENEKNFHHVHIYLVNDIQDSDKAGLLFKYDQFQFDLKIHKKQGRQLQKTGQLKNINCQLWMQSYMQWVSVQTTIKLQQQ